MGIGLRRLLMWGVPLAAATLLFRAPSDRLLEYTIAHLLVLQIATFSYAIEISNLVDEPWFLSSRRPELSRAASLVAVVVGFSALLTLGTSAAAGFDPSLQFLQLLSSLDIAWVVAAIYLGALMMRGRRMALVAGSLLLLACVASIAVYLTVVGFGPSGEWVVDGAKLLQIVIPSDTVAAVLATTVLLVGTSRSRQATLQASPQS